MLVVLIMLWCCAPLFWLQLKYVGAAGSPCLSAAGGGGGGESTPEPATSDLAGHAVETLDPACPSLPVRTHRPPRPSGDDWAPEASLLDVPNC